MPNTSRLELSSGTAGSISVWPTLNLNSVSVSGNMSSLGGTLVFL